MGVSKSVRVLFNGMEACYGIHFDNSEIASSVITHMAAACPSDPGIQR